MKIYYIINLYINSLRLKVCAIMLIIKLLSKVCFWFFIRAKQRVLHLFNWGLLGFWPFLFIVYTLKKVPFILSICILNLWTGSHNVIIHCSSIEFLLKQGWNTEIRILKHSEHNLLFLGFEVHFSQWILLDLFVQLIFFLDSNWYNSLT